MAEVITTWCHYSQKLTTYRKGGYGWYGFESFLQGHTQDPCESKTLKKILSNGQLPKSYSQEFTSTKLSDGHKP